jgi:translation elongation factor EF-1alpha
MNEHFCVSLNPLVKLFISHFSVIDPDLVAHNKARLRLTRNNQVSEIAIICLDIALSRGEAKSLFSHSQHMKTRTHELVHGIDKRSKRYLLKQLAKRHQNLSFTRELIRRPRICRDIESWNA